MTAKYWFISFIQLQVSQKFLKNAHRRTSCLYSSNQIGVYLASHYFKIAWYKDQRDLIKMVQRRILSEYGSKSALVSF